MKSQWDIVMISRIVLTLVIGSIFFYLIFNMMSFGEKNMDRQTGNIYEMVDKALIQCYALEGSYPSDIYYLKRYGIIFDDSKFIYHYEMEGANLKPNVKILAK